MYGENGVQWSLDPLLFDEDRGDDDDMRGHRLEPTRLSALRAKGSLTGFFKPPIDRGAAETRAMRCICIYGI